VDVDFGLPVHVGLAVVEPVAVGVVGGPRGWSRRPSTASRWPSAVAHPADGNLLDNCNTHVRWEVWANVHPSSERTHTLCPDMRVELAEFDSAAAAWQGVQGVMHLEQALSHALCS